MKPHKNNSEVARKGLPWVQFAPQTPLEVALHGKVYQHHVWCNASRKVPIGTVGSGCICLRTIAVL